MKQTYLLNLFLILIIALSSCSPYATSKYFEGIDRNSGITHKVDNYVPLTIQTGDILAINVKSLSPEGSAIFNGDNSAGATGTAGSGSGGGGSTGYLVDQNGEIELPLVHKVKVLGMTIEEAQNTLARAVTPFLKEPVVTVHVSNFKVTVIGDVGSPSMITVSGDHMSIPEALSQVGDLTASGRRDNVLLIREINGERKYVNIDLTSPKLIESPYYYLKNNDVLYIEAGRGKFSTISPLKQNLPIFLSFLSVLILAFELYKRY